MTDGTNPDGDSPSPTGSRSRKPPAGDNGFLRHPYFRWIVASIVAAIVLSGILVYVFVLPEPSPEPFPPWRGRGDWETCAEKVSVSPEDAIRRTAAFRNLTMKDLTENWIVSVRAVTLNDTGWGFKLDCETLQPEDLGPDFKYHPEERTGAGSGWFVHLTWDGARILVHHQVVDWEDGEILAWATAA